MESDDFRDVFLTHLRRLSLISSSVKSWNAALALSILAFTSASDPPCSSMMLPRYVKDSTSSTASPPSLIGSVFAVLHKEGTRAAINTSRTRAEKAKAQAEYTEVNKQVKRSIRTDKRKYVEDLAMTAEKAARGGNMRQLYDTTKKLARNHRKPERPVKSKEGKVIANTKKQRNRWVEHFKERLNRPAPLNPPNIEAAPTDLPIVHG
ncbi:unnamed protein product [Schistosoma mattheei]|uniref:Uncharacterized protein n=1 Tax=Schistosoma mattheei TaxID=31246 RepID=A0A183P6P9_9TREM|nr:unnamed protein product [Schistosoma mattheei]